MYIVISRALEARYQIVINFASARERVDWLKSVSTALFVSEVGLRWRTGGCYIVFWDSSEMYGRAAFHESLYF